jgi:hypothetical protein
MEDQDLKEIMAIMKAEIGEEEEVKENDPAEVKEEVEEESEEKEPETQEEQEGEDKEEVQSTGIVEESESKEEPEKKVLGSTPEEIEALISQRVEKSIQDREAGLKEQYEVQSKEAQYLSDLKKIEMAYSQYEEAIPQLEQLLSEGKITPQDYARAINKASQDMSQLKNEYLYLQNSTQQLNIPKIKRANQEYYQQQMNEMPELKDEVVKKYAEKLKASVFDAGGIEMAKGGFNSYVKDFLAAAVTEAEARGRQKAINELQKQNAKAKASSVVQQGNTVTTKPSKTLKTAEDMLNASDEDIVNFVLKANK